MIKLTNTQTTPPLIHHIGPSPARPASPLASTAPPPPRRRPAAASYGFTLLPFSLPSFPSLPLSRSPSSLLLAAGKCRTLPAGRQSAAPGQTSFSYFLAWPAHHPSPSPPYSSPSPRSSRGHVLSLGNRSRCCLRLPSAVVGFPLGSPRSLFW